MKHKAPQEPKPFRAFRDNYLAAIMMVAALLISSVVSAQLDSAKYSRINGYGFGYKRMVFDSVLMIPRSTSPHVPYRAGAIRYNNPDSTLQLWTGSQWMSIVTGVGNGVDTAYMVNDTTLVIETPDENFFLPVSKRHVDSIYRKPGQDSIYYTVAGIERAIKDSAGSSLTLTNTGTGYSLVTTPNGSIKKLFPGYGVLFDSTTTANSITAMVDTSGANPVVTQSDLNDAIGGAVGTTCQISHALEGADISATLQNLINSGCKNIVLPRGKFIIGTTVQMSDSVMISGEGKATVIELTKNIPAFKCSWSGGGNKSTFKDFSFLGTYPQDSTSQDGILSDSCNGILTHNISAMKLGGWAIHFKNNGFCCSGYPLPTGVIGNLTSDCFIDSCYGGVFHDTRGEFNSVVNTTVVRGKYGVYTSSGSSRIEACNLSGTDYGVVITGGANNAHGTMIGTHIAHSRRIGLYVTGASNGFEIIGTNIRQDSILIENSDNIRFTACELGALDDAINVTNSTNTIFSLNRVWGSNPFGSVSSGTKMITADSATNGISLVDLVNGKRFDISHTNGLVDFTGTDIRRIRMLNDTLNFSNNGTVHVYAGGENATDSLVFTSTTSATKGRIKFGNSAAAMVYTEANGRLGIGTSNPQTQLYIHGSGVQEASIVGANASSYSRWTFNNAADGTIGAQMLFGGTSTAFNPGGIVISNIKNPLAISCEQSDIRFTKSALINGANEHARFTNAGSFLFGTTTDDPSKGRFQINSRSRFDSLMHLNNVPAPSGAYNLFVHDLTDSSFKQVPVTAIGGITSINSQTGPAITISNQGAIVVTNPSANTIGLAVDVTSDLLTRTIDAIITTAQNSGTGETDLFSKSIAGLTLNTDKQTLNFEIDGEFNDNTATAQLKLYFGGNVTLNTGAVAISTPFTGWRLKGHIIRTSSSTAHVSYELLAPGLATALFVGYSNLTSLDFTSPNIFKISAQAGGAGGGTGDITAHSWQITYKPQP
jgi:hypothetical protein